MKELLDPIGSDPVLQAMEEDWRRVGQDVWQAMQETADMLGGTDLMVHVTDIAVGDGSATLLPSRESYAFLEDLVPGISEDIHARSVEIRQARRAEEQRAARRQGRRDGFHAFLAGLRFANPIVPVSIQRRR